MHWGDFGWGMGFGMQRGDNERGIREDERRPHEMTDRLEQARESLEDAELLYRERVGNKLVIAKLYHAMIYCLFALFGVREIGNLTHADIIERFENDSRRQ